MLWLQTHLYREKLGCIRSSRSTTAHRTFRIMQYLHTLYPDQMAQGLSDRRSCLGKDHVDDLKPELIGSGEAVKIDVFEMEGWMQT
jgi:hypothetical protein